jgi:transposase
MGEIMSTDATAMRSTPEKQAKPLSSENNIGAATSTTDTKAAVETGSYETIKVDRRERVGLITLYRPKRLNALIIISIILTAAHRHDVTQLLPLIDAIPPIRGIRGRPLQKPQVVYADRGYDSEAHRQKLRDRGIKPVLAKRRTEHGSGLGKYRWVVERTHAWFHNFHRLRVRYERLAKIHEAFLKFATCLICWRTFKRSIQPFLKPPLNNKSRLS